jgi:hypothetical protein
MPHHLQRRQRSQGGVPVNRASQALASVAASFSPGNSDSGLRRVPWSGLWRPGSTLAGTASAFGAGLQPGQALTIADRTASHDFNERRLSGTASDHRERPGCAKRA